MPELPEVETIRRQLHERLAGKTVREVFIFASGREFPSGQAFIDQLTGDRAYPDARKGGRPVPRSPVRRGEGGLQGVMRRAKLLVFNFVDGRAMLAHLKMTGKFLFVDDQYLQGKHDRILFVLSDGTRLVWSDIRKFGYLKIVSADELAAVLSQYGPEPLESTVDELADRLLGPKARKIKTALLDQSTIAGLGNIYADEACHCAGVLPTRRLDSLTLADRRRLATEIVAVLSESLALNGTTSNDYVDTLGTKGGFSALLKVYGRSGRPCLTCSTPITRIVLGGRGTHFCPKCQK